MTIFEYILAVITACVLLRIIKEFFMPLIKNKNKLRISTSDWINGFVVSKFKAGENVSLAVEADCDYGEQIVISANQSHGRRVLHASADVVVDPDVYLLVVDASQNPVVVTLPVAHDYTGLLSIVCADAAHGIELIPNASTQNVIFDLSNVVFHAKGDSVSLVSDKGQSDSLPPNEDEMGNGGGVDTQAITAPALLTPGTWYIVAKYSAQWYA